LESSLPYLGIFIVDSSGERIDNHIASCRLESSRGDTADAHVHVSKCCHELAYHDVVRCR
jgi:hypothetical protein